MYPVGRGRGARWGPAKRSQLSAFQTGAEPSCEILQVVDTAWMWLDGRDVVGSKADVSVLGRVSLWAAHHEMVRAVVLESSRAMSGAPIDVLSDYDVLLIVTDPQLFAEDQAWLSYFGTPVVSFRDADQIWGFATFARLVLYEDGTKVDHIIWPAALLRQVVERETLPDLLDWGYLVLLDKDGLATRLPTPTYTAHIPARPSNREFQALIEEFWWETTYVAKHLWRDDLMCAKYNLDVVMK